MCANHSAITAVLRQQVAIDFVRLIRKHPQLGTVCWKGTVEVSAAVTGTVLPCCRLCPCGGARPSLRSDIQKYLAPPSRPAGPFFCAARVSRVRFQKKPIFMTGWLGQ
jgi:hypothetical protein